jgi:hypothetical protein
MNSTNCVLDSYSNDRRQAHVSRYGDGKSNYNSIPIFNPLNRHFPSKGFHHKLLASLVQFLHREASDIEASEHKRPDRGYSGGPVGYMGGYMGASSIRPLSEESDFWWGYIPRTRLSQRYPGLDIFGEEGLDLKLLELDFLVIMFVGNLLLRIGNWARGFARDGQLR